MWSELTFWNILPNTFIVYTGFLWVVAADEIQSERGKQSVREKCQDYLARAEQLKEFLKKRENAPAKPVKAIPAGDKGYDWLHNITTTFCVKITFVLILTL